MNTNNNNNINNNKFISNFEMDKMQTFENYFPENNVKNFI